MTRRRLEFSMPAEAAVVFDAFHYHRWRSRWDSLVARARWAASMQHRADGSASSVLIYTYNLETYPAPLRQCVEPVVDAVLLRQTRRRFERLSAFLGRHAADVRRWQAEGKPR
jgi:hypothetical protein